MYSVSAVDRGAVTAYAKVLALIVRSYEINLSVVHRKYIAAQYRASLVFYERFSMDEKIYRKVVQSIVNGISPTNDDQLHEDITDLGLDIRLYKKDFAAELDMTRTEISFLNSFCTAVLSGSVPAVKKIHKDVSHWQDPVMNSAFVEEKDFGASQREDIRRRRQIAKKLMGSSDHIITTEEKKAVRAESPENENLIKEYTKLTTKINAAPKEIIKNTVRASGKKYLPISEVIRAIAEQKVEHQLPVKFKGFITDTGQFLTKEGVLLHGTVFKHIRYNEKYDAKTDTGYVLQHKSDTGKDWHEMYSVRHHSNAKQTKFKAVRELSANLATFRKKWVNMLKGGLETRQDFLAFMAELAYQTSGRIGGKKNETKGVRTFGLSTLKGKHIKIKGNKAYIKYKGKDAMMQAHIVREADGPVHKLLFKVLKDRSENTEPNEYLLTYNDRITTSMEMKKFLTQRIGIPAKLGVHSFRTARGTGMAITALSSKKHPKSWAKKPPTQKEVNDFFTKAVTPIGKRLGHFTGDKVTTATAIKNYIDPSVLEAFFKRIGQRPNTTIQSVIDLAKKNS